MKTSGEPDPSSLVNQSQIKSQPSNQVVYLKRPGFVRKPLTIAELPAVDFNALSMNQIMLSPYNIASCDRSYVLKQVREI